MAHWEDESQGSSDTGEHLGWGDRQEVPWETEWGRAQLLLSLHNTLLN